MSEHYVDRRKIGVPSSAKKPDGTPDWNDRIEIGPTALAFAEWEEAGLEAPNLEQMRLYRLERLANQLQQRDLAAVLVFDPLNIRYCSDTTNMQLWNTHNAFRACLVTALGYMIVWDYKATDLLTSFNPLVRETRSGASMFYFACGDGLERDGRRFAKEIKSILREHCGTNVRLAIDKIAIAGLRAFEAVGIDVIDGEEVMEKSRAIKGPDEIKAMRCAIYACEQSLYAMQKEVRPGISENDVWSILHAENIKRGGEWIETRLLASGPRTNPWFQECGPRILQNNEILAFDTDLIGCYGMCVDISRTWWVGDEEPTKEHKRLFTEAYLQISQNIEVLGPEVPMKNVVFGGRLMPEEYVNRQYSCKMHGVGLCDEWPLIVYPQEYEEGRFDELLKPGMMLCSESYIGAVGGSFGIKLEDQVLITEEGVENMTQFPFDERLLELN